MVFFGSVSPVVGVALVGVVLRERSVTLSTKGLE